MPTILFGLFLFFLFKQQIMTHSSSWIAATLRFALAGPDKVRVQTQVNEWKRQERPSSPVPFFCVLLVPLVFKFCCEEALAEDKTAASDRGARSKYRPRPESRACATTCVSSNTPSRLGLTRENRLCVNTDSDLDLWWEGEEERWMEIWKKGWQSGGERGVVQKERVGWFLWLGQQKGARRTRVWHLTPDIRSEERSPGVGRPY